MPRARSFDYIVVGAGSAGCVLANRLSADPERSVLLIEAGGKDRNPLFRLPMLMGRLFHSGIYNWRYHTERVPSLDGRSLYWPRGKVLGGSSTINGMIYVRGNRHDYDRWAQMGLSGWSYDEVLPAFRRSEGHMERDGAFHGTGGELTVCRARGTNPLFDAFVEAGRQAGHPLNDDFNGAEQEGVGRYDFTIRRGRRCSASTAFLNPIGQRRNLAILTDSLVRRVSVEGGRATGIEVAVGDRARTIRAEREVILCAGTVNSPQLLMLSGIGPGEALGRHGIPVIHELPGVGRNLQDHVDCVLAYACTKPITLYRDLRADRLIRSVIEGMLLGRGIATTFPYEAGAFFKSRAEALAPDIQVHFMPALESAANLHLPNPFKEAPVTAGSRTVTIPASGSATLTLATAGDSTDEPDGSVTVTVADGTGYTVGSSGSGTVSVLDDDDAAPPVAAVDPALVAEVRAMAAQTQHGAAHVKRWRRVLVAFGVEEYPGLTPTTLAEAKANAQKYSSPLWPKIVEALEKLEAAAQQDQDQPQQQTPEIAVTANAAAVTEGGDAVFTLTATPAPAADLTVSVTVATDGDWGVTAGSRTVTIPTTGSATLTLATTGDDADEPDGSVTVTVADGSGWTAGDPASGTVAIRDDDAALPVVTIVAGASVTEGGDAVFTLTASPAPAADLAVSVSVAADGDWGVTAGTQTVTIPNGSRTASGWCAPATWRRSMPRSTRWTRPSRRSARSITARAGGSPPSVTSSSPRGSRASCAPYLTCRSRCASRCAPRSEPQHPVAPACAPSAPHCRRPRWRATRWPRPRFRRGA